MEWDGVRLGWGGKGRECCFLHTSVMTQVEDVSVVPIAPLNTWLLFGGVAVPTFSRCSIHTAEDLEEEKTPCQESHGSTLK